MSTLYYSPAAEKKAATLLDIYAQINLAGYGVNMSHYLKELDRAAHAFAFQIMRNNDETTGLRAAQDEIKAELAADNEEQS